MIHYQTGDLFTADVAALVNPVNTKGVAGKGLALQFKKAFPDNFAKYRHACTLGDVVCGSVFIVYRGVTANPRWIINFPTKRHWRQPSKLAYIEVGLEHLVEKINLFKIRSLAIPALGCGEGGLHWADVQPLIVQAFEGLPHVHATLFAPQQEME